MRVYIAAPYPMRDTAIHVMHEIEAHGHTVTSRWLKTLDGENSETAQKDLDDIDESDVLLALNPLTWTGSGTGGRHVEFGYALAHDKYIMLVGEKTNIFHKLHYIDHFPTIEGAIETLDSL